MSSGNVSKMMIDLKKSGTAQNRKVYARHGVDREMFGVSFSELGKLQKKIKVDHGLALALWETGNHDARVLATKIADPTISTVKELTAWLKEVDNYVIADAFAQFVAKTAHAGRRSEIWRKSKNEWTGRIGWVLRNLRVIKDPSLPVTALKADLARIAETIHQQPNRLREAMNYTLMAVGIYRPDLLKTTIKVAKKVGKVEIDHGETGCKTPDAQAYIAKALARKKSGPKKKS